MSASLFPDFDSSQVYRAALFPSGGTELAYRTMMVELALMEDDAAKIGEAIERGWIHHGTTSFDHTPMLRYAIFRNAPKVAAFLRAAGFPERVPMRVPSPLSSLARDAGRQADPVTT